MAKTRRGEPCVVTRGLTKRYGSRTAVEDVDLTIRRGEVYGFLGPNGAGKTTTLRMIVGLIRPTSGEVTVLGSSPGDPANLSKIGALIEGPAFYPYLSGIQNLRVLARYSGVGDDRIEEVLAVVDLEGRADDKFSTYSLGMKQRLGVAGALLNDPELLILDEPTNGLDPRGMSDMRDLVRRLGQEKRAIVISSHLLGEVEQICDRVGVIQDGRLIAENSVAALRGPGALLVRATPQADAMRLIQGLPGVTDVREEDGALRVSTTPESAAVINAALVGGGIAVSELRPVQESLEAVFLNLTDESITPEPVAEATGRRS